MNINVNIKPFWAGFGLGTIITYFAYKLWLMYIIASAFGGGFI